jgi:hypothetical protein
VEDLDVETVTGVVVVLDGDIEAVPHEQRYLWGAKIASEPDT